LIDCTEVKYVNCFFYKLTHAAAVRLLLNGERCKPQNVGWHFY